MALFACLVLQDEYEKLSRKIEEVGRKSDPCKPGGEFAVFSNTERRNHHAIVKVPTPYCDSHNPNFFTVRSCHVACSGWTVSLYYFTI